MSKTNFKMMAVVGVLLFASTVSVMPSANADFYNWCGNDPSLPPGPVAIVNGAPTCEYGGRWYDTRGVTGNGTVGDPWVVRGVNLSMQWLAMPDPVHPNLSLSVYPEAVVVVNSTNVLVQGAETWARPTQPYGMVWPGLPEPGEYATFGVRVTNSQNVHVNGSVIKFARIAGVWFDASTGNISYSDVKYNWGAAVLVTGGSSVSSYGNLYHGDGWVYRAPGQDVMVMPEVAVYAIGASSVQSNSDAFDQNVNAFVADLRDGSSASATGDSFTYSHEQGVVGLAAVNDGLQEEGRSSIPWEWEPQMAMGPEGTSGVPQPQNGVGVAGHMAPPHAGAPTVSADMSVPKVLGAVAGIDARLNWWNSPQGAGNSVAGFSADSVAGLVTVSPHLAAPPPIPALMSMTNGACATSWVTSCTVQGVSLYNPQVCQFGGSLRTCTPGVLPHEYRVIHSMLQSVLSTNDASGLLFGMLS